MYLLKNKCTIVIIAVLLVFSCKKEGPLTPEEAFTFLQNAYVNSDAVKIESLLSEKSIEKIKNITTIFSSMSESQLRALSARFNINPARLKNLTVKDYLAMHLSQNDKNSDILKIITDQKIIGTDINEKSAIVRLENGMEVIFVKEGHYWKFDMEELSSKD
jgi:hypothetical protein